MLSSASFWPGCLLAEVEPDLPSAEIYQMKGKEPHEACVAYGARS